MSKQVIDGVAGRRGYTCFTPKSALGLNGAKSHRRSHKKRMMAGAAATACCEHGVLITSTYLFGTERCDCGRRCKLLGTSER